MTWFIFVDAAKHYRRPFQKDPFHYLVAHTDQIYAEDKTAFSLLEKELLFGRLFDPNYNYGNYYSCLSGKLFRDVWETSIRDMYDYSWRQPEKNYNALYALSPERLIEKPWFYCLKDSRKYLTT